MFNTKFVFAVSIVAMMAVNVADANIAATSYVDRGVTAATNAANAAQTSANSANTAAGNAQTSADNAQDAADAAQVSANAAKTAADAAQASATAANNAIAGLDLSSVGADGSYIKTISQSDGKVSATKESADTAPTSGSKKMVTSGGVYTALDGKVNVTQGTTNAGKGLVVDGTTGKLALVDVATQAELNVLNTSNSNVSADVTTLKSDVSGLKTSVSELDSEKQDVISDLATIRSGAAAGSTALQKADIATGTSNGTISVDGTNVAVKGLGSAAYKASSAYATAAQGTKADGAVQTNQGTTNAGKGLVVDGTTGDLTLTDVATQAELDAVNTTAGNAVVANPAITGGTGTKITYDSKGLVTGSTSLVASDIPTLASSKISGLGTISAANMGTSATTVVAAIKEVAGEAAAAQETADKAVQTDQTTTNANKIMITNASGSVTPVGITASGLGNVVTAVSVEDGKLTVTKETTLGSLATKSSVASSDITNGAVATADLADGAVTTAKIAADAVTNAKLADNAVQTENIAAGAVGTTDIASSAVTTAKIADGNVTTAKIAANAVTVAKTSGIYGYIPTASDGSGAAQIWVE